METYIEGLQLAWSVAWLGDGELGANFINWRIRKWGALYRKSPGVYKAIMTEIGGQQRIYGRIGRKSLSRREDERAHFHEVRNGGCMTNKSEEIKEELQHTTETLDG